MSGGSSDIEVAIARMEAAAEKLPGAFQAEVALVRYGGVSEGAEHWSCEVDGDLDDAPFAIWAHTPTEAITWAVREAWRRVPPGLDGYVRVASAPIGGDPGDQFTEWLWMVGMDADEFAGDALRVVDSEVGREYFVRPSAIPHHESPPGLGTREGSRLPLKP